MNNPFNNSSTLNLPLQRDICQQIHYAALRHAAYGQHDAGIPDTVPLESLANRARWHGPSIYLLHPDDIERIFQGVTLAVYQTIAILYCSRVERDATTVRRILRAMAESAGVQLVSDEAIWAICLFLDGKRKTESAVTIERTTATWWVTRIEPDFQIQEGVAAPYQPCIVCVFDEQLSKVLSLRVERRTDIPTLLSLAFYDAAVAQRQPTRDATAGLRWSVPARVVIDEPVELEFVRFCETVGIGLEISAIKTAYPSAILSVLQGNWVGDFVGGALQKDRFVMLFDTYLYRALRYSPLRARERQERDFVHLVGYNRDPTWQFPALRLLLPTYSGVISADGTIVHNGLHYTDRYEDNLLSYWRGHVVTLRRSEHTEAATWIYFDGEVLGQGMAEELRRRDGSYRPWRAVR